MLSCLGPRYFEDLDHSIMSPSAFQLQIPSPKLPGISNELERDGGSFHMPQIHPIQCPQCRQTFLGYQCLKIHMELAHVCSSKVVEENRFDQPLIIDTSMSPVPPLSVSRSGSLLDSTGSSPITGSNDRSISPSTSTEENNYHLPTSKFHTKNIDLPFSSNGNVNCNKCQKTFANVYRLQRHMISHEESVLLRKFKCNQCDKAFKFKHHLKEHLRIHSGEKPFGCNNCGKRFSHSGSYSSHMTSKKCISMGLKLNAARTSMHTQKLNNFYNMSQQLNPSGGNVGGGGGVLPGMAVPLADRNIDTNVNMADNIKNNNLPFPSMLHKYNNGYDAMNAAFLASFQNPFYPMTSLDLPAFNPYSIHRLLELTAANASHHTTMEAIKHVNGAASVESHHHQPHHTVGGGELQSDPEDMIEEVTEENEENFKDTELTHIDDKILTAPNSPAADVHNDEAMQVVKDEHVQHISMSSPIVSSRPSSRLNSLSSVTQRLLRASLLKLESEESIVKSPQPCPIIAKQEVRIDEEEHTNEENCSPLRCYRCNKTFYHHTELNQHEKMLCCMNDEQLRESEATALRSDYIAVSGSEDDGDEHSKTSVDGERKVRIRTSISEEQQQVLKEHYATNSRPSRDEFRAIAHRLMLDPRVVQVWFQNNRSRERKMNSSSTLKQSFLNNNDSFVTAPDNSIPTINAVDEQPLDLSVKKEQISHLNALPYFTSPSEDFNDNEIMDLSGGGKLKTSQSPVHQQQSYDNRELLYPQQPFPKSFMSWPMPNKMIPDAAAHDIRMKQYFRAAFESQNHHQHMMIRHKRGWRSDSGMKRMKKEPEVEGQFACDECDKTFIKQSSLARHKYEHSGQRPYKCDECPKAFKHKHHLTEHKRLHSGEKPFQCPKCLKRFSHSGSYSQHMNHRFSNCKPDGM